VGPLDRFLFEQWNSVPDRAAIPFRFMSTAFDLWWMRAVLLIYVGWLLYSPQSRKAGLLAICLWPLANGLTDVLKHTWPMHRPIDEPVKLILRVGESHSAGTASAHAANMIFIAWIMVRYLPQHAAHWFAIAMLVGASRVVVGAHFPSQVFLGWLCGTLAAALVIGVEFWISSYRANANAKRPVAE
jgi:undecaprenyl-diphosphatase